jgi:hypothetical protein
MIIDFYFDPSVFLFGIAFYEKDSEHNYNEFDICFSFFTLTFKYF